MLGRDTEWRQGSLLTHESAIALGIGGGPGAERPVVVISHDCDLANDAEEQVEVIIGTLIDLPGALYENARNPRQLHLTFVAVGDDVLHIELRHADRRLVSKAEFAKLGVGSPRFALPAEEKRVLKQWLAARYGRPAFPNSFETRLRKHVRKRVTVEKGIAGILEPASTHLVGLFFDLGEDRTAELAEGEPYFLSISVVYDATEGGHAARETAESVANALRALFEQAYGTIDVATEIALENCGAVADTYMTLADLRKVDQWRLEYISLRDEPISHFLPTGERPV